MFIEIHNIYIIEIHNIYIIEIHNIYIGVNIYIYICICIFILQFMNCFNWYINSMSKINPDITLYI